MTLQNAFEHRNSKYVNLGQLYFVEKYTIVNVDCCNLLGSFGRYLFIVSRIILVYYCKCCNLIGYSTRYLFLDR